MPSDKRILYSSNVHTGGWVMMTSPCRAFLIFFPFAYIRGFNLCISVQESKHHLANFR